MNQYSVIVIGAGLAGLMAARTLENQKINYLVLEKGPTVGGRMATWRFQEGGQCDYGAQFFTVRSETMKQFAEEWQQNGLVNVWTNGFHQMKSIDQLESLTLYQDGYPRYAGRNGMNSITQYLAKGLVISFNQKVEKIAVRNKQWEVTVKKENGETILYYADKLIITSPIPESLQLLEKGESKIDGQVKQQLEKTSYFPCLAAMVTLTKKTNIPSPGGIQIAEGTVGFIGDNQQKGISELPAVTIHGGDQWSRDHEHLPDEEILQLLINAAKPLLGEGEIFEKRLVRWNYSKPENLYPDEFAYSNIPLRIAFAGDIFKRGAVEGAILSGLRAADWIVNGSV